MRVENENMPLIYGIAILLFLGCSRNNTVETNAEVRFNNPTKVTILDYSDHVMEPFLSRDGTTLFFNNLNDPSVNTNLHLASKVNDSTFQYQGELKGLNTQYLEGVPTVDNSNNLYFVSTRNYEQTLSTLYQAVIFNDSAVGVDLVDGISKNQTGWLNFDVEVNAKGDRLYFVDGRFDQNGGPYEADIIIAEKMGNTFQRKANQSIVKAINTEALEYAACISHDELELYFTRVDAPLTNTSQPQIFRTSRNSINEAFGMPVKVAEMNGFVEAPTITSDGKTLYYHKRENQKFVLYKIEKTE